MITILVIIISFMSMIISLFIFFITITFIIIFAASANVIIIVLLKMCYGNVLVDSKYRGPKAQLRYFREMQYCSTLFLISLLGIYIAHLQNLIIFRNS